MQVGPIGVEYDDQAAVLRWAAQHARVVQHSEAQQLAAAVRWASFHGAGSLVGPVAEWDDRMLPIAGEGAPEVTEFCIAEFAAVLGKTTDAGRRYMGDALDLAHRLRRTHARVMDGTLEVWRARQIAQATRCLPPLGAAWVDREVAPHAHKIGIVKLTRIVEEAMARFDPEQAAARAAAAAEQRRVDVHRDDLAHAGLADVVATIDLADADDVEAAIARRAAKLGADGDDDSLDVRRARALGQMARADLGLDLATGERGPAAGTGVELRIHVNGDDLASGSGLARVERTRDFIHLDALRRWLARSDLKVAVRGVIDTRETIRVDQYEIPDRLRQQVAERDGHCVFPWCNHPGTDIDHITPYDPDGPPGQTSSDNLARICRRHHRHKTFGGWSYTMLEPAHYLWRSPHGHRFLVTPGGTHAFD